MCVFTQRILSSRANGPRNTKRTHFHAQTPGMKHGVLLYLPVFLSVFARKVFPLVRAVTPRNVLSCSRAGRSTSRCSIFGPGRTPCRRNKPGYWIHRPRRSIVRPGRIPCCRSIPGQRVCTCLRSRFVPARRPSRRSSSTPGTNRWPSILSRSRFVPARKPSRRSSSNQWTNRWPLILFRSRFAPARRPCRRSMSSSPECRWPIGLIRSIAGPEGSAWNRRSLLRICHQPV
jgi:hypothetical protein